MKANTKPLIPECYYHVYNRGINGEALFKKDKHYDYFLSKYVFHVSAYANTFAYCLLGNHFHFLIQIKTEKEIQDKVEEVYPGKEVLSISTFISNQFAHMFNGYSQSFNNEMRRTGGLFESPFRRIEVNEENYFSQLIVYIHHNPQKHGIVNDFKNYPHSSYSTHLSDRDTYLEREEVLDWFGGREQYEKFHEIEIKKDCQILRLTLE